jgi:hypothetical protein
VPDFHSSKELKPLDFEWECEVELERARTHPRSLRPDRSPRIGWRRRLAIGQASSDLESLGHAQETPVCALVDLLECASLGRLRVAAGAVSKRAAGLLNEL